MIYFKYKNDAMQYHYKQAYIYIYHSPSWSDQPHSTTMLALHIKLIGGIRKGLGFQEQMLTMLQQRVHGDQPACSRQSTLLRISPMSLMDTSNILLSKKAAMMFRMRLVNHVSCCCCCFRVSAWFLGRVETIANLLANCFIWNSNILLLNELGTLGWG